MYAMSELTTIFTPIRYLVSKLHLKMPWSYEELLPEFENEEWKPHGEVAPVGHNPWPGMRYKVLCPKWENRRLTAISRYFGSDEFKRQSIDWMYDNYPGTDVAWGMDRDTMFRRSQTHIEFTRDMPGFVNNLHTDYRLLIATGMIYFHPKDDEQVSSWFYKTETREDPVRMTTAWGDGWWHQNGNYTWHEGWNKTDQVRYSGLLGLTVHTSDVPKYPQHNQIKAANDRSRTNSSTDETISQNVS